MDIKAREGQKVRITWNHPVGFGRYANDILWSAVEGVMGADDIIHNLTAYGMDIEYPEDSVCFTPDSYEIIEAELGFLDLLKSMNSGEIIVLRWDEGHSVMQKEQGDVWCFPGTSKEYTSEEVAEFPNLVGIDKLEWLL